MITEFEMKDELHEVENMITQVLEVMLNKLVLD